eukprot:GHVS01077215.1.p1 GENE.GHVS01077215.1~~GHVS01077215.1.p1  ORF type:complete len:1771 (+),score=399.07 GHVS01077215.1:44-5356(+)
MDLPSKPDGGSASSSSATTTTTTTTTITTTSSASGVAMNKVAATGDSGVVAMDNVAATGDSDGWIVDVHGESLKAARLVLSDGRSFSGYSFGFPQSVSGEVVFNTGMVGYPESLTDPSYQGQLLVITYPLVGNYGVPENTKDAHGVPLAFEGDRIHVTALVVADYSMTASHYTASRTLASWLVEQRVPAITGVDTRAITKHIREHGSMLGRLLIGDTTTPVAEMVWEDPNCRNLIAEVSRKDVREYISQPESECKRVPPTLAMVDSIDEEMEASSRSRRFTILGIDCGMKYNIVRNFLYYLPFHIKFRVVPWDYDFSGEDFDGLFLSNGPGDPTQCGPIVDNIRKVMQRGKPIFGICLGNQLLALAGGALTYKMKFGNRGMNQPVVDLRTSRCYITSQNHGYAVESASLSSEWMQFFVNANDQSNEGIIHKLQPWFSVQFHPEAAGGPTDTVFLFADFLRAVSKPSLIPVSMVPLQFPIVSQKVLLLGSGGLSIGQAGEFDYSGSQAIKALKEGNATVVLINPNIATVQTTAALADKLYFLPVTPEFVEKVICKERPDSILCTFGGQTALNCAVALHRRGILAKYECAVLGTPIDVIIATEDRQKFVAKLTEVNEKCAESMAGATTDECVAAARRIGFPVLVRAAFALGGLGSGFAANEEELLKICKEAFVHSAQVFVDKSLKGWKEIEYEVIRDSKDNCITVCNMENFDPLGIHTGDSIVVAPSQTLSNSEYYRLRETAIKVIRHLGVVGECNIQYAVDPCSDEYCIVEVNARLSRSSALASKATGYPLAYVSAKLAMGHDLLHVRNCVTKSTTACFEPSLDYVVTKVPRWDLSKFAAVDQRLGSAMKSVGEVMAIGRTFEESLQKALRMVEERAVGFDAAGFIDDVDVALIEKELCNPTPKRIWALAHALQAGYSVDRLHELTQIDKWFLAKLASIDGLKRRLHVSSLDCLTAEIFRHVKKYGFSDKHIGLLLTPPVAESAVRARRQMLNVYPYVKQIDTLAAEYPAHTNYLYLTYQGCEHDVTSLTAPPADATTTVEESPASHVYCGRSGGYGRTNFNGTAAPSSAYANSASSSPMASARMQARYTTHHQLLNGCVGGGAGGVAGRLAPVRPGASFIDEPHRYGDAFGGGGTMGRAVVAGRSSAAAALCSVIVLGCGCYRIGSSVEFDWSAMSCVRTLRSLGHKAIVVNCNPETVSTDYDESDRLYFEELSLETVMDIWEFESPEGMIVSVGGQTPNNLAWGLHANGVSILGTSVESIDTCEDRNKFSELCDSLKIDQPAWSAFTSLEAALEFCDRVSYPVLVRPSYVLSGACMQVVPDKTHLHHFLQGATRVSREHPVVISKYIENAKEVEMDSVACEGEILNYAISEHVENAGVHSGDASLILPAQKLYVETIRRVRKLSQRIAKALMISGPFNIQFMCRQNEVKIIECNLRASRTFPFISKTFNVNFIEQATRVMVGAPVRIANVQLVDVNFVGVKVPMFSFTRLPGADPILGVEMQSTGEVACFGSNKFEAFLKALLSAGMTLPSKSVLLSAGPLAAKLEFEPYARLLYHMGFVLYMTEGTYKFFMRHWFNKDVEEEEQNNSSSNGGSTDDKSSSKAAEKKKNSRQQRWREESLRLECGSASPLSGPVHRLSRWRTIDDPLPLPATGGGGGGGSLIGPSAADGSKGGKLVLVEKPLSGKLPSAVQLIDDGEVEFVINIPESMDSKAVTNGYMIRRSAIDCAVPLVTDIKVASLFVEALRRKWYKEAQGKSFWDIKSWDEYVAA